MRRLVGFVVALVPAIALAAPTPQEKSAATKLFKEGKAAMTAGNYAVACPKLEESQRLDPGGGTLLNLAVCREGEGKLLLALSLFREALELAKQDGRKDREKLAQEHIDAIEKQAARLRIVVATPAPEGLAVTLDGKPASTGVSIIVEVGEHRVEATAPQHVPFAITVTAEANATRDVAVPTLAPEVVTTPPPPPPVIEPPPPPPPKPIETKPIDRPEPEKPSRVPSFVAFGVGGAALVATGVFSWQALAQQKKSDRECTAGCNDAGITYNDRAKTWADAATVSLGVGVAAIVVGVVAWPWSSPSKPSSASTVTLVPQPLGLALHGAF